MEELKQWLKDNYFSLLSQSETIGFQQAYDLIRLKIQDLIDENNNTQDKVVNSLEQ